MNKLFRKTRSQLRALGQTDDQSESGDDAAKLPATEASDQQHQQQQQQQQQSDVPATMTTTGGDMADVVLRLEVPSVPKLRSSSIDASYLHQGEMNDVELPTGRATISPAGSDVSLADRDQGAATSTTTSSLLRVDLPKCFRRRSLEVARLCIHCVHLEALAASATGRDDSSGMSSPFSAVAAGDTAWPDSRCSSPSDAESTSDDDDCPGPTDCTAPPPNVAAAFDISSQMDATPSRTLLWSQQQQQQMQQQHTFYLTSPDSHRFSVVTADRCAETDSVNERASSGAGSNRSSVGSGGENGSCTAAGGAAADWKEIVTLQVPLIKPRSSSLDVTYYASTLRPPGDDDADDDRRCSCENLTLPDAAKHRSTSVDVNLPTDASGGSYRAITGYAADSNK